MEKYFEISRDHQVYKEYFDWLEFRKKILDIYKKFASVQGIETSEFLPRQDTVGIVPIKGDNEKFDKFLKKQDERIRFFKKGSAHAKDWEQLLAIEDIKITYKPNISWYFNGCKSRTRLFDIDGKLYGSYESDLDKIDLPVGFEEMKASKFFKIIEDWEASQKW